jgi:parvulin-like peptidyl-prolyl isomerase
MNSPRTSCHRVIVLALLVSGCPQPFPEDVVARYDGGVVTAPELEERILVEPPGRRVPPQDSSVSMSDWKRRFARTIVAERTWFEAIDLNDIDDHPQLRDRLEAIRHAVVKRFILLEGLQLGAPVHEDQIRALYEQRKPSLELTSSYTVRHLYVRVDEDAPEEQWEHALNRAVQARRLLIASDADIDAIIAEHSDSEDSSQGGWIRQLRLGRLNLSPAFEDAVRALSPGEVSEPVRTRRGYQIIVLVDYRPGRTLAYDEVRDRLLNQLVSERREQRLAEVMAEMRARHPLDFDLEAFRSGDPEAAVILGMDGSVTRRRLMTIEPSLVGFLDAALENGSDAGMEYVDRLLETQWLLAYADETGLSQSPELREQLEQQEFRAVVEYVFQQEYERWLSERDSEELRKFFEENRPRFSTPRELHLKALFIEHQSPDLYATYALVEELAERLRNGASFEETVATHATYPGPTGDGDFGWNSHQQIAAHGKAFYDAVLGAEVGQWTGPVKWDRGYAVVQVADIREPQPLAFDEAANSVRRAYTRRMRAEHFETLVDTVFLERSGELNESWFESVGQ